MMAEITSCSTCDGIGYLYDQPLPHHMVDCTEACEVWPACTVCGMTKHPIGRSVATIMVNGLCDFECPGYGQPPRAGHLFPGELRRTRERLCPDCEGGS